jgi:cytosine/adenosine deaminase-related metal-dependent hydrolase
MQMATTLVRGRHVLVRAELDGTSRLLSNGAVAHENGVVTDVGAFNDLRRRYPDARVIGNGRQFLIPGLVNAHHHGRGVTGFQMGQPDGPLELWIQRGMGRRPLDPRLMTLYTIMQMIRSGTTTVMFNQSSGPADGTIPEAAATLDAFVEAGMRVAFSVAFRNQCTVVYGDDETFFSGLPHDLADSIRRIVRATDHPFDEYLGLTRGFAKQHAGSDSVRILLSPQNYQWADEETLGRIGDAARTEGFGIHTHLVETAYQRRYAERLHGGQTPAHRLREVGFLGPGVSIAHGVWLTRDDIGILADTRTAVSHNPSSNLRLHSGIAPVLDMLGGGITVGQGTDSNAINDDDDMLQEMGLTLRLHRPVGIDNPPINAHQVIHMATLGGAELTMFGGEIGSLEVGRRADMALIDWDRISSPVLDSELDILDVLLGRARAKDIDTVIIAGDAVLEDRAFTQLDEDGIREEIREALKGPLPPEVAERRRISIEMAPYIRRFYSDWDVPIGPYYQYNSVS